MMNRMMNRMIKKCIAFFLCFLFFISYGSFVIPIYNETFDNEVLADSLPLQQTLDSVELPNWQQQEDLEYGTEGKKPVLASSEISSKLDPYAGKDKDALLAKVVKGINRLNEYRSKLGLPEFNYNEQLTYAAQGHSNYLNINNKTGHYQSPGDQGFFGETSMDRANYFGYYGSVGECISYGDDNVVMAIDILMDAPYHRLNHIDPILEDVGIGIDGDITTVLYGTKTWMEDDRIVVYPYEGQTDVKTKWFVAENPNPLRFFGKDRIYVGYPISMSVHDYNTIELKTISASLKDKKGNDIAFYLVDSSKETDFKQHVFIIPKEPLKLATEYTVSVQAVRVTRNRKEIPIEKEWTSKTMESIPVTGVSLFTTAMTMRIGTTSALIATVFPYDATNKEVVWSSSNESVAVVDSNGNVTAIGKGKATITVTTVDGGYTDSCEVNVSSNDVLNIYRITGSNRIVTAVNISYEGWPGGARYAVLTSGWEFADALAGTTFAYLKDAPILLTRTNSLADEVKEELERLGVKKVYILGGNKAISDAVVDKLISLGYSVERIYGSERFETAVKIGDEIRKEKPFDTVILATSHNFPDALAIGPVAARGGIPILFTRPGSLHNTTKEAILRWGVKKAIIVGGNEAVSKDIENELKRMGLSVERVSGSDRYATAIAISNKFCKGNFSGVMMATGLDFADALAGSVLAARNGMPIILSRQTVLVPNVEEYLSETNFGKSNIVVLGGTAAIADEVINLIWWMWWIRW